MGQSLQSLVKETGVEGGAFETLLSRKLGDEALSISPALSLCCFSYSAFPSLPTGKSQVLLATPER